MEISKYSNQIREIEFLELLIKMLNGSDEYESILKEPRIGFSKRFRPDITAYRGDTRYIIECKSKLAYSNSEIYKIRDYILDLKAFANENDIMVFATPSRISTEVKSDFLNYKIEIWDIDYLMSAFRKDTFVKNNFNYNFIHFYDKHYYEESFKSELIKKLDVCQPGKDSWSEYQRLVGLIVEELFCPPLSKPLPEYSDVTNTNRKDYVLPNYCNEGFWKFLREKYNAEYIVVEAKNYKNRVGKNQILQVANYLKPYGTGMFAFIFSRYGVDDKGGKQTIKEQWIMENKMIIVFEDSDVKNMLLADTIEGVEQIISDKIQEFRLSL